MAEIYLARPVGGRQTMILKRLRPTHADSREHVQMLVDEAELMARLDHPNVVRVRDTSCVADQHFFTMDWVQGASLLRICDALRRRGEKPSLGFAIGVVREAALGVHHAHELAGEDGASLGVVHRDLSPSNVMVGFDGGIRVIDFGVARARQRVAETGGRFIKGKLGYMSPEQALGKKLDRRTDVFALGILLYEATTGTRLFSGSSDYTILEKIVKGRVPAPSTRVKRYPRELETIVMGALARNPDERYASAARLAEALAQVASRFGIVLSAANRGMLLRQLFAKPKTERHGAGSALGSSSRRHIRRRRLARGTAPPHPRASCLPGSSAAILRSARHGNGLSAPPADRAHSLAAAVGSLLAENWFLAAIAQFEAQVAIAPADLPGRSRYYLARACAALSSGREETARELVALAVQVDPRNAQALRLFEALW